MHEEIKLLIHTNWKKNYFWHFQVLITVQLVLICVLKNGFLNEFAVSVNDATTSKPIINQFYEATFANVTRVNNYDCSCKVITNQLHSTQKVRCKPKCILTLEIYVYGICVVCEYYNKMYFSCLSDDNFS